MSIIYKGILLLGMSVPILIFGGSNDKVKYDFCHDDSSYSFHGSFVVEAEPACLKSVVFDFNH